MPIPSTRRCDDVMRIVEDELLVHTHIEFPTVALELPGLQAAVRGQAYVDAAMRHQAPAVSSAEW